MQHFNKFKLLRAKIRLSGFLSEALEAIRKNLNGIANGENNFTANLLTHRAHQQMITHLSKKSSLSEMIVATFENTTVFCHECGTRIDDHVVIGDTALCRDCIHQAMELFESHAWKPVDDAMTVTMSLDSSSIIEVRYTDLSTRTLLLGETVFKNIEGDPENIVSFRVLLGVPSCSKVQ